MDERDRRTRAGRGNREGGPASKPTIRQIYAVARALCEKNDEPFPETRAEASRLIDRLRGA